MGKHFLQHGVKKYAVTQYEDYRVQLFNDAKSASEEDKKLFAEVQQHLSGMSQVHDLALAMLDDMQQVLMSDELLADQQVRLRLKTFFGIEGLKVKSGTAWDALANVVAKTRTGLAGDKRVKFARITEPGEQKPGGAWAYGAVQPRNTKQLESAGYFQKENKKKVLEKNQATLEGLEFDNDDSEEFIQKTKNKWRKLVSEAKSDYANAFRLDRRLEAKAVRNPLQPDIYMGGIKLDMFSFTQRMQGGEQALVARTLVHEATHRFAGTEDHAYMKPDGSGPKPDTPEGLRVNSDYTEKPIQPDDWLGNADSYAHFAYWVWKDGGTITKSD